MRQHQLKATLHELSREMKCFAARRWAWCVARQRAGGLTGGLRIAGEPRDGARRRKNRWCLREERPSGRSAAPLKDLEPELQRLTAGDRALAPPVWPGVMDRANGRGNFRQWRIIIKRAFCSQRSASSASPTKRMSLAFDEILLHNLDILLQAGSAPLRHLSTLQNTNW